MADQTARSARVEGIMNDGGQSTRGKIAKARENVASEGTSRRWAKPQRVRRVAVVRNACSKDLVCGYPSTALATNDRAIASRSLSGRPSHCREALLGT